MAQESSNIVSLVSRPETSDPLGNVNPHAGGFEISKEATLIIQNLLVYRFFAKLFHHLNFDEKNY